MREKMGTLKVPNKEKVGIEIDGTSGTEGKSRYGIGRYTTGRNIPVRQIPIHLVGSEHA
jgi:hypothetical protein